VYTNHCTLKNVNSYVGSEGVHDIWMRVGYLLTLQLWAINSGYASKYPSIK